MTPQKTSAFERKDAAGFRALGKTIHHQFCRYLDWVFLRISKLRRAYEENCLFAPGHSSKQ
jgi:hypothetical protein